jgi:hypothetical protein
VRLHTRWRRLTKELPTEGGDRGRTPTTSRNPPAMSSRRAWRITADDYGGFITGLCGMPPGAERDPCVKALLRRLLSLYAEYGGTPAPGLREFAERVGISGDGVA